MSGIKCDERLPMEEAGTKTQAVAKIQERLTQRRIETLPVTPNHSSPAHVVKGVPLPIAVHHNLSVEALLQKLRLQR
jgi:hypothetical protein